MKISRALFVPASAGFFFDDQRAIKNGARHDGFTYVGKTKTAGFRRIREAGEAISCVLVLEDGQTALGDCAAVQYSGAGGRDPLFLAESYIPFLEQEVRPLLEGREITGFRSMAGEICRLQFHGRPMHRALQYGLSQVLLDARAKSLRVPPCLVICREYGLPVPDRAVPVFGQTGDDRYDGVDKMIIKRADVLPHGLINNINDKLGRDGGKLADYIEWIAARIKLLRLDPSYVPAIHIDVYGTIGLIFQNDIHKTADYIAGLEGAAGGFPLYIEGPVDMEEKSRQIDALAKIRNLLEDRNCRVRIVADEWCNTKEDIRDFADAGAGHMIQIKTPDLGGIQNVVESVLECRERGVEAYQGGTCNETDISARLCVHAGLAARADRILAKPGMGFDEGFMVVKNEMNRTLALLRALHN
ncbi:MAG: methylaspartate ammonia-lyase [Spirochaetia bacterium]